MNKFAFIISLILLTSINSKAQQQTTKAPKKYIIVDRRLKDPIRFADNITKEQLGMGYFAVEKQNILPLISKLDSLSARLRNVVREKYDEDSLIIGSTVLSIKVIKQSFGDRLNVSLSTNSGNSYNKSFYIVDAKLTNNDNARYLNRLIKYLKKINS
ncbi:MAG TPA: hypothetical protein VNS32_25410 [Flavisolibacter sp.]|nr:hypothetical protein [Flavisolibacter sp.]